MILKKKLANQIPVIIILFCCLSLNSFSQHFKCFYKDFAFKTEGAWIEGKSEDSTIITYRPENHTVIVESQGQPVKYYTQYRFEEDGIPMIEFDEPIMIQKDSTEILLLAYKEKSTKNEIYDITIESVYTKYRTMENIYVVTILTDEFDYENNSYIEDLPNRIVKGISYTCIMLED